MAKTIGNNPNYKESNMAAPSQRRMKLEDGEKWTVLRKQALEALNKEVVPFFVPDSPKGVIYLMERILARRLDEIYSKAKSKVKCVKAGIIDCNLERLYKSIRPAPRKDLVAIVLRLMVEKGEAVLAHEARIQKVVTSGTVAELADLVVTLEAL